MSSYGAHMIEAYSSSERKFSKFPKFLERNLKFC